MPIALAGPIAAAPAAPAAAPAAPAASAAAPAASTRTASTRTASTHATHTAAAPSASGVPLATLDRRIQQSLQALRDDANGLLANSFVPDAGALDELEAGVQGIRGCVDRYNAAAAAAERAAAAARERLAAALKPVKIERTQATKPIYAAHAAKMGGQRRFLYKCPCADAVGVCAKGSASRPLRPSARKHVIAHIERWHMGSDPLRTYRRSDAWWDEGADRARAKPRRRTARCPMPDA